VSDHRLGVLAFGDSITNGGGELQWGVALQSWALWVARATGLPLTNHATDGAGAADVVRTQMPAFLERTAVPGARYHLGAMYIGVNDVRAFDWDAARYEAAIREALGFLRDRCDRLVVLTAPLDLGRPPAGAKVGELNGVIRAAAAEMAALVVDLSDFGARNLLMPDHVHPTAFGQIAIAERALAVLADDGLAVRVSPRSLIQFETTWKQRLQSDIAYTYRHAKISARAAWVARRAARPGPVG
jgi:lysophospholipase L1-like esterase